MSCPSSTNSEDALIDMQRDVSTLLEYVVGVSVFGLLQGQNHSYDLTLTRRITAVQHWWEESIKKLLAKKLTI